MVIIPVLVRIMHVIILALVRIMHALFTKRQLMHLYFCSIRVFLQFPIQCPDMISASCHVIISALVRIMHALSTKRRFLCCVILLAASLLHVAFYLVYANGTN